MFSMRRRWAEISAPFMRGIKLHIWTERIKIEETRSSRRKLSLTSVSGCNGKVSFAGKIVSTKANSRGGNFSSRKKYFHCLSLLETSRKENRKFSFSFLLAQMAVVTPYGTEKKSVKINVLSVYHRFNQGKLEKKKIIHWLGESSSRKFCWTEQEHVKNTTGTLLNELQLLLKHSTNKKRLSVTE